MLATRHTQSLTDFRQKANETLERLNRTGEAEILTVNGEARAVLLSPAIYDSLAREAGVGRDIAVIGMATQQIDEGKSQEVDDYFNGLRQKLSAMSSSQTPDSAK